MGPGAGEAGVHVIYGLVGLKTHTKTALVVRDERRRHPPLLPHRHRQLQLARRPALYEDLGLLTCDPDIGADLTQLFNYLTGYGRNVRYRKLLVAPPRRAPRASRSSSRNEARAARAGLRAAS